MKKSAVVKQDHTPIDDALQFANYAGDLALTPAGLHYLGMVKLPHKARLVPISTSNADPLENIRRAV